MATPAQRGRARGCLGGDLASLQPWFGPMQYGIADSFLRLMNVAFSKPFKVVHILKLFLLCHNLAPGGECS